MGDLLYKDFTYELIGVLFDVHNELGGGFLEVVYADAVEYELKKRNIPYETGKEISGSLQRHCSTTSLLCRFCRLRKDNPGVEIGYSYT